SITTTPHRKSLPLSDESESQNKAKRDFCSSLLDLCFDACRSPKTAAHFGRHALADKSSLTTPFAGFSRHC
ncbi:hypothetical protein NKI38_12245, partial [Mesorhizobium sp. M0621]|uniref:hypothetical protein n=1 Tax=Mesorhizobium sp. M0621 TaxID=2956974 RepID=UPI00333A0B51